MQFEYFKSYIFIKGTQEYFWYESLHVDVNFVGAEHKTEHIWKILSWRFEKYVTRQAVYF